jgi:hypothetical protein
MNLGQAKNLLKNPNFVKWFGKSPVKDEVGEPLTVYKGMPTYDDNGIPFTSIKRQSEFPAFNHGEKGVDVAGFYSSDPDVASHFAKVTSNRGGVFPGYLSFQKPFIMDAKGRPAGVMEFGDTGLPFREAIRSGKYDGVIIKNTQDEGDVYVALKAEQFKSKFNKGTFDPTNPNILKGATAIAAGSTLLPKDALAQKHKKMESDQALQDAYSPVDMIIAGATGGATMGLRAISALADPVINYAIDRMLGD